MSLLAFGETLKKGEINLHLEICYFFFSAARLAGL